MTNGNAVPRKRDSAWIKRQMADEVEILLSVDDYADPSWVRGLIDFILDLPDDDRRFEALDDQLTPDMLSDYFKCCLLPYTGDRVPIKVDAESSSAGLDPRLVKALSYSSFVDLILIEAVSYRLGRLRGLQRAQPDVWAWGPLVADELAAPGLKTEGPSDVGVFILPTSTESSSSGG